MWSVFLWLTITLFVAVAQAGDHSATSDSASTTTVAPAGRYDVLLTWGETALNDDRFSEAEECFRQVLDADWNNPRAFELLQRARHARESTLREWRYSAHAAEQDARWDLATHYYQLILRESPHDGAASRGMAQSVQQQEAQRHVDAGLERFVLGDYAAAQAAFEQALQIRPGDSLVTLYLQRAEQETMQSSSLADIRADQTMWPKYLDALKRFRAGDLPGAEALWRQVLEKYPGNEAVLSNLEQITRRRKKEFSAEDVNP